MLLSSPRRLAALLLAGGAVPSDALLAAAPGALGAPQASQLVTALLLLVAGFSQPTAAQPTWMDYPSGQVIWATANDACSAAGGRLCSHTEYCPQGSPGQPNQSIPGNSRGIFHRDWGWAPTGHAFNDWALVGTSRSYMRCKSHAQTYGAPPDQPAFGLNGAEHVSPAFCCCLGCPALVTSSPTVSPASDHDTCSNIVYCYNGRAQVDSDFAQDTGQTCAEACDGNCCTSDNNSACSGNVRLKVCADEGDGSCTGSSACNAAGGSNVIPGIFYGGLGLISGGSCVGDHACSNFALTGNVGSVSERSCRGTKACMQMAIGQGRVGNISGGSCQGEEACYFLGRTNSEVGDITGSCRADNACSLLRAGNTVATGPLHSCCNSPNECASSDCTEVDSICNRDANPVPENCIATPAPTPAGPWTLDYDGLEANFTSSASNEVEVGFFMGVGRAVEVAVLETCDADADPVPSGVYSKTVSPVPAESNTTHNKIIVGYNFDKAQMIDSSLWNGTTDQFKFCQVVSLTSPDPDGGEAWVITEDRREIDIQFDLVANFVIDVDLADGTIENATETVAFDNDVDAYKCNGGSANPFVSDDAALPPNTELAVCITIDNDSVNIADVTNMTINQDVVTTVVIDGGSVLVPAITDKRNVPDQGFVVKTRVPLDKFTFENGRNITISGSIDLELVGTTGTRKLRTLVGEDDLAVAGTEEAAFALSVNLEGEAKGFGPIGSSDGHAIVGKGFATLGLAVVAAIGLVM